MNARDSLAQIGRVEVRRKGNYINFTTTNYCIQSTQCIKSAVHWVPCRLFEGFNGISWSKIFNILLLPNMVFDTKVHVNHLSKLV